MRAIVLARAQGKTARMLGWLILDPQRVLVVMSTREQDRLVRTFAGSAPEVTARIVTIHDVLLGRTQGRWESPVFGIDELDQVLAAIFYGPVEVVAFSGEVES